MRIRGQPRIRWKGPTAAFELMAAEDAGWDELHGLMDSLTSEETEEPGYYPQGWSAKDLLAHVGSWLAEAGVVLQRIRVCTYKLEEFDIDWNLPSFRRQR